MRNRFTAPTAVPGLPGGTPGWSGDHTYYDWPVNHTDEESTGKARNVTRTANTANVGAVRQQADDGGVQLKLTGTILSRAQLLSFWTWFAYCKTSTIIFTDFDGQSYEVQMTDFQPTRKRKLRSIGQDPSIPFHYYTYTMTLDIYRFVAGEMFAAGITP